MLKIEYVSADGHVKDAFEMADGMTLNQAAKTICPDSGGKFPIPTIAIVGARPAVRELGDWDFPLADARVQFRQLAMGGGGGGSNPLQMVLQIAIIALAAAATWYIGGTGAVLGIEALGMSGLWSGLAGAGIMMLGTMLMGALFQNQLPQGQIGSMNAEQASPTYNINSSGNQARLYQQEPELFGQMKIVPDFVANTWTQYIENDQIGYFVYGIGRGHYAVESMSFGETVFWRDGAVVEESGYDIQAVEFVVPGNPVTIFPDNVINSSEVSGQELFAPNDEEFEGAIGPYSTNAPGTFTDRLLFDFVFQQGLGWYDDAGGLNYFEVAWKIEAREIDDFGNPKGDWFILENISMSMATLTPQRVTKSYNVPKGRYECRVVRTSDTTGDGRAMDALVWSAMRAMLPGTYTYPISCVAIAIKANNALTQSASRQFSLTAIRKLPIYDRKMKKWGPEQPTRSWAAAVSHVCRSQWGGRLDDANIDLDTLWAIDEKLQTKGRDRNGNVKPWTYDAYIDGPYLVWTLICEMCQSQCVFPRMIGPVLSFVPDEPKRPPVFALTPRNIMRNSFSVNYATWSEDTPDDVTVEYLDADYGYQQRDVTAVLPDSESREPSSLDILGITDRDHAHKVAVAYAAHNRWQRISVECQVEALGRIINRGDICTVAHPRFKNTCAGIVEKWDADQLSICFRRDMDWPLAETGYYLEAGKNGDILELTPLGEYGVKIRGKFTFWPEARLLMEPPVENGAKDAAAGGVAEIRYLGLTRPDGSIWGPCRLASITGGKFFLDAADYFDLLKQQGNPFEWLTWGKDRQPTTWTLYTATTYQRLMMVDSVTSQDFLHYSLKLLNYDDRIYQYDNLETPLWQGRGQLPDSWTLVAPPNFRGVAQNRTTLFLTWLGVAGAEWYEVEVSGDGETWNGFGRITATSLTVTVPAGTAYARVRAMNSGETGAWSTWEGDTSLVKPDAPKLALEGRYIGGEARITWGKTARAKGYAVSLLNGGGTVVYTTKTTGTFFNITPEIQRGGPYRNLTVKVSAYNDGGASAEARLALGDPLPQAPTNAVFEAFTSGNPYILLTEITPVPEDVTGYVLAKGDNEYFNISNFTEIREISKLPYFWYNISGGTHYFRVAVRDAFYDIARNPRNLNWSAVQTVEVDASIDTGDNGSN